MSIVLADDHPNFPKLVESLLKPVFEIVGSVKDGKSLIETSLRLSPDIVITDISMPILNGIDAVDWLRKSGSTAKVIFLTVHSDADFVHACLDVGALGIVVKPRMATELLTAIREVLAGRVYVSPFLSDKN